MAQVGSSDCSAEQCTAATGYLVMTVVEVYKALTQGPCASRGTFSLESKHAEIKHCVFAGICG